MMFPAFPMTRDQIREVDPETPENAGRAFVPFSHGDVIKTVLDGFKKDNLKPLARRYALSGDKNELSVSMDFDPSIRIKDYLDDYHMSFGFVTSNNRNRSLTFYCGISAGSYDKVTEKHGMAFSVIHSKKHTSGTDLQLIVLDAVEAWYEQCKLVIEQVDEFKRSLLKQKTIDHLLMESCRGPRHHAFKWSKLGLVDEQHRTDVKEIKARTAWSLFVAFAKINRENIPFRQMDIAVRFRQLLTLTEADKTQKI